MSEYGVVGYRVEIDKDACISTGRCVSDAPEGFAFDADELSEALPGVTELDGARLVRIARNCPNRAILLFDEDGARIDLD